MALHFGFCENALFQVFDVLLNGEIIIPNLDIFNEAKGTGIAYDRLIGFYVLFLRKKLYRLQLKITKRSTI